MSTTPPIEPLQSTITWIPASQKPQLKDGDMHQFLVRFNDSKFTVMATYFARTGAFEDPYHLDGENFKVDDDGLGEGWLYAIPDDDGYKCSIVEGVITHYAELPQIDPEP